MTDAEPLADYITRIVKAAPPLSPEVRLRLAGIMAGVRVAPEPKPISEPLDLRIEL